MPAKKQTTTAETAPEGVEPEAQAPQTPEDTEPTGPVTVDEATAPPPVATPKPAKAPKKAPDGPFQGDQKALDAFVVNEYETNIKLANDAIRQACADAAAIEERRIKESAEGKALLEDLGNVSLRQKFLEKFGPSNVRPPRPKPGPRGDKTPEVLLWDATYTPREFIERYERSEAPNIVRLRKEALARLS